jgi:hypothetical protein
MNLVANLPPSFLHLFNYLIRLTYESRPDYDYIRLLYQELFEFSGMPSDTPYDWDSVILDQANEVTKSDSLVLPGSVEKSITSMAVANSSPLQRSVAVAADYANLNVDYLLLTLD